MTTEIYSLKLPAGIQKDGTRFDAPCYTDGKWVRFQRSVPRKIGGYRGIFLNAAGIIRGMIQQSDNGENFIYGGYSGGIQYWQTSNSVGTGAGPFDITINGFTPNDQYLWQFDVAYDSNGEGELSLIGHPGLNLQNIDNTVNTPVYIGKFPNGPLRKVGTFDVTGIVKNNTTIELSTVNYLIGIGQTVIATGIPPNTVVTKVEVTTTPNTSTLITISNPITGSPTQFTFDNNIEVSGGCVMLYPYLFVYGDNGLLKNCSAGNFEDWVGADANENNVSATKIVKGLPVRGGTSAPAGLFWSLDSLIRVSYAPTTVGTSTTYWSYDIISTQTSIMSSQCVIEYDGIYYWVGTDRFLMYNGVVKEMVNNVNSNYFFDNLNYAQRQKVWVTKVPRFGEIWWFYPHGNSTECNNAIIFNVRENTWYDAGFANGARRSSGTFSEVFRFPVWAENVKNTKGTYTVWQHEAGQNETYLTSVNAIQSYFETNNLGWVTGGMGQKAPKGLNRWMHLERIEPDFVQTGDMTVYVTGQSYASEDAIETTSYTFSPNTPKIDMREQRREMRLRFESNTQDGDYQLGNVLISADIGDERGTGNP